MPTQFIDLGAADHILTEGDADYVVTGGDGNNTLTFGNGADRLTLGNGTNTLTLGNGANQITLGGGNNTVTTGSGPNTINATDGNNTITVGDGNDNVSLGNGLNTITSGNGDSTISVGNSAGDTIHVGLGSNTIALGTGAGDVVHTMSGNNTISVAAASLGGDTILGNLSNTNATANKLVLTTAGIIDSTGVSGVGIYELANGGPSTLTLSDANFARVSGGSITVLEGTGAGAIDASSLSVAHSVSIYSGSGTNMVTGGAGNDFFYGSPGESTIDGGAGSDTMTFTGPASNYSVTMVAGVTHVVGNGETDTLTNIEQLVFGAVPCFAAGTFIDVPQGQVAVEQLQIGNDVRLASGGVASIIWIGRRVYGGRFLSARPELLPILIRKGAWGTAFRDEISRVSPLHSMLLDGVLVPAKHLVNGTTVVRDVLSKQVEYIHIELERHDIILAEGAPAETFLDDDSRGLFHNAAEYAVLYPEGRVTGGFCAPRVDGGFELEAIRRRLDDVGVQECRLDREGAQRFAVRAGACVVRFVACSGDASGDMPFLGVAVSRIAVDGADLLPDDPRLAAGWHGCSGCWELTGRGALLVTSGAKEVEITVRALSSKQAA